MRTKECPVCGSEVPKSNAVYCSKRCCSIGNLKKIKPKKVEPNKICKTCGTAFHVKPSHLKNKYYCSKECMSEDYKKRMEGEGNPNYKNAGWRKCEYCGAIYHAYDKRRKYCSQKCYQGSTKSIGAEPLTKRLHKRAKDKNHNEIVGYFEDLGVSVLDASDMGHGFPDTICGFRGENYLVEIKNPNTHYGRQGLNKLQRKFALNWLTPVYVVGTMDDVIALVEKWIKGRGG